MKIKSLFLKSAFALVASALIPTSAQATLLIYEGFSGYTNGALAGQSVTATGLTGTWTQGYASPVPTTITGTGLTFGSGASTYAVTGGAANQVAGSFSGGFAAQLNTGDITGTLYGSYLFNLGAAPYTGGIGFQSYFSGTAGNFMSASAVYNQFMAIQYNAADTPTTNNTLPLYQYNTTCMAISKWDNIGGVGTGNGTLWVLTAANYANVIASGLTDANLNLYNTVKLTTSGNTFTLGNSNSYHFDISGYPAGTVTMDEIKFGTTLADVAAVPEPATYVLFGFGALVLIVAYRRKRVA